MRVATALRALLELPDEQRFLGPFKLIRPLGAGGFAPVWLASEVYGDVVLREAAVKLFPVEPSTQDGRVSWSSGSGASAPERQRVIDEARALCRVEHPNVVRFYAMQIDEARGVLGLAMELVAGRALEDKIRRDGKLSLRDTLDVALCVSSALGAVHRAGLVHRDIKPQNIVETSGSYKLIDFGIAAAERRVDAPARTRPSGTTRRVVLDDIPLDIGSKMSALPDPSEPSTSPVSGFGVAGTLGYVDPECVADPSIAAVASSDIYALGVVLFECVCGVLPAVAASSSGQGLDPRVVDGRAPSPSLRALAPDTPAPLVALVDAMLAPRRVDRPRSIDAVVLEIERIRSILSGRPRLLPPEDDGPFRGLARFEEADRDVFFGRSTEVAAIVELLRSRPVVALVGASGTGKSSLARAGVLPALSDGALGGWPRSWETVVLCPGEDPAARLHETLMSRLDPALVSSEGLTAAIADTVRKNGTGLVLLIDQAEELVTMASVVARERAIEILAPLCAQVIPGLRVVFAVRQDLLDELAALPGLGTVLLRSAYVVQPLTDVAWSEVLLQALDAYGYGFEGDALRDELVLQLRGTAEAMPLVQFALSQLWASRDRTNKRVTHAALQSIGGIAGALERHAERTFVAISSEIDGAEREVRSLLVSMTSSHNSRDWVPTAKAIASAGASGAMVLAKLSDARLVVQERGRVTIAHEALLTRWARLRGWLDEIEHDRHLAEELERDAARWDTGVESLRDETLLWRRHRLAAAIELRERGVVPFSAMATSFVTASIALERRGSRRRSAAVASAIVAGAVSLLWVISKLSVLESQRSVAEEQNARGRCERARNDRVQAVAWLAEGHAARAVATLRRADATCPAPARDASLMLVDALVALGDRQGALAEARRLQSAEGVPVAVQRAAKQSVLDLNVAPPTKDALDAARNLVNEARKTTAHETSRGMYRAAIRAGLDDTMVLYEAGLTERSTGHVADAQMLFDRVMANLDRAGHPARPLVPPSVAPLRSIVWPASSPSLVVGSSRTVLLSWHPLLSAQSLDGDTLQVSASESARQVATMCTDSTLRLWEPGRERPVGAMTARWPIESAIALSRDGRRVAAATRSQQGATTLWVERDGKPTRIELPVVQATSLVFSPDASRLATLGADGSVKLWEISAEPRQQNVGVVDGATVIEMTSRHIIVGTSSGESFVWRAPFTGQPVRSKRHSSRIQAISTAEDRLVATAASDGTVSVWDAESGAAAGPSVTTEMPVVSAALSADGRWMMIAHGAASDDDPSRALDRATIGLWDLKTGKRAGRIGWLGNDIGYFLSSHDQIELFGADASKKLRCEAEVGGTRTVFEFALCEDRFVVPGLLNATLHGDALGVVE